MFGIFKKKDKAPGLVFKLERGFGPVIGYQVKISKVPGKPGWIRVKAGKQDNTLKCTSIEAATHKGEFLGKTNITVQTPAGEGTFVVKTNKLENYMLTNLWQ